MGGMLKLQQKMTIHYFPFHLWGNLTGHPQTDSCTSHLFNIYTWFTDSKLHSRYQFMGAVVAMIVW